MCVINLKRQDSFLPFFSYLSIRETNLVFRQIMNAIIIEDEPLAVLMLEKVLRKIAPEVTVQARLDSVGESVEWLSNNRTELIFSDIHLGDGQSFEIFDRVEVKVPVIFITAYDEYAIQAFKKQGIDYILKPFEEEDIRRALDKVETFRGQKEQPVGQTELYQERFLVQIGTKIRSVAVEDVAYFMADGKYLMLFTFEGASYIVDQTMAGIEERLNPRLFFRINRKFIISFQAIKEMAKYSNSRIKVILTPEPPENIEAIVSAERIREFKEWLNR